MSYQEEPLTLRQTGHAAIIGLLCLAAFALAVTVLPPLFRSAVPAVINGLHTIAAPSDHEE